MSATNLSDPALTVLRTFHRLAESDEVLTVHAAAIGGRMTYMQTFDLVNELFGAGHLSPDLTLTDAGRKAIA